MSFTNEAMTALLSLSDLHTSLISSLDSSLTAPTPYGVGIPAVFW